MSIQHTLSRDTGRVYLPRPKDSLITAYFPSYKLLNISSIEMSSLPVVYGTVGRIEPLLDPAILGRFADLPQNGKPTRAVCRNMQLCYRCHPPSCKGVGVIKAQLQLAANVDVPVASDILGLQVKYPWSTCGSEAPCRICDARRGHWTRQ